MVRGNFEAAVEALDGCAIDVGAERERIASAMLGQAQHFAKAMALLARLQSWCGLARY